MPNKKHHVKLTTDEHHELAAVARKQNASTSKAKKARALLAVDCAPGAPSATDKVAAAGSSLTERSLQRLRMRACESGPLGALERKPRETPLVEAKVIGELEAQLVKLACSEAPAGRARWTMKMIAERLVEMDLIDTISGETVRTTLKKTGSSHGSRNAGVSHRT